jgi:hypothetical protein
MGLETGHEAEVRELMGKGLTRWDAMLALVEAGIDPGEIIGLQGVPKAALFAAPDAQSFARGLAQMDGGLAMTDPAGANRALGAYLAGRTIEGDLDFYEFRWVTSLPEGLKVRGDVVLVETGLKDLPDDLEVDGCLYVGESALTVLPRGLVVGGQLDLRDTGVRSLPPDLKVASLNLEYTHVKDLPASVAVAHELNAWASDLETLPDHLHLTGDLILARSKLVSLPKGLVVGQCLDLMSCLNWDGVLPDDLQVGGEVRTDATCLDDPSTSCYEDICFEGVPLARLRELQDPGRDRPNLASLIMAMRATGVEDPVEAIRQIKAGMKPLDWREVDKADFAKGLPKALAIGTGDGTLFRLDSELWSLAVDLAGQGLSELKVNGAEGKWLHPLTHLPRSLAKAKTLDLRKIHTLTGFPEGIRMEAVRGCSATLVELATLKTIPPGHYKGLQIKSCGVVTLPDELQIDEGLALEECWALKTLPADLVVKGEVTLANCTVLGNLPPGTYKSLTIKGCPTLQELPEGVRVLGDLRLESCGGLVRLPKGLEVLGNLLISDCGALEGLPDGLRVGGEVKAGLVPKMVAIGSGVDVGSLNLDGCANLATVGDGLRVKRTASLEGLAQLTRLGADCTVGAELKLTGCAALEALPEGLVAAELKLAGCERLAKIPDDLILLGKAGADPELPPTLDLRGLLALERMPMGAVVGQLLLDPRQLPLVPLQGDGSEMLWKVGPTHLRKELEARAWRVRPSVP